MPIGGGVRSLGTITTVHLDALVEHEVELTWLACGWLWIRRRSGFDVRAELRSRS